MEKSRSWETITNMGLDISQRWKSLAEKHELPLEISGIPALVGFSLPLENMLKYKTFITQEMLKENYLAATSIYVSTAHGLDDIDPYFELLDPIFSQIKDCEDGGRDIDSLLHGPICHSVFKRLN